MSEWHGAGAGRSYGMEPTYDAVATYTALYTFAMLVTRALAITTFASAEEFQGNLADGVKYEVRRARCVNRMTWGAAPPRAARSASAGN